MTRHAAEEWLLRVQLPAGLPNPGRTMAAILKHLGRVWGVKATAILAESHLSVQDGRSDGETAARPTQQKEAP